MDTPTPVPKISISSQSPRISVLPAILSPRHYNQNPHRPDSPSPTNPPSTTRHIRTSQRSPSEDPPPSNDLFIPGVPCPMFQLHQPCILPASVSPHPSLSDDKLEEDGDLKPQKDWLDHTELKRSSGHKLDIPRSDHALSSPSLTTNSDLSTTNIEDSDLVLAIHIVKAKDLLAADPNGLSDPYCCVSVFRDKKPLAELTGCSRSHTHFYTLSPKWDYTFIFPSVDYNKHRVRLKFDVFDYDEGWHDDALGSHEFILTEDFTFDKVVSAPLSRKTLLGSDSNGTIYFSISIKSKSQSSQNTPEEQKIQKWRSIVQRLGNFPIIHTYYQRFDPLFFTPDDLRKTCNFFSVDNTSIIDQHYHLHGTSGEPFEIKENGKQCIIDLKAGHFKVTPTQGAAPSTLPLLSAPRLEKWYWKTNGGDWKPYTDEQQARIWHAYIYRLPTLTLQWNKQQYCIHLNRKEQENLKTGAKRKIITEEEFYPLYDFLPDYPTAHVTNGGVELLKLEIESKEFQMVSKYFYLTMPTKTDNAPSNTIRSISKIINHNLREAWLTELTLVKKLAVQSKREALSKNSSRLLWHGTSGTHPSVIYNGNKGWKVNFAGEGNLWGKGLYFSQDAVYSAGKYAFTTDSGTQLLLLAEVIVGDSIYMMETKATKKLKDAPIIKGTNQNYDCVIGNRHGTWIFVTYESSRAYPMYMVEYHPKH